LRRDPAGISSDNGGGEAVAREGALGKDSATVEKTAATWMMTGTMMRMTTWIMKKRNQRIGLHGPEEVVCEHAGGGEAVAREGALGKDSAHH